MSKSRHTRPGGRPAGGSRHRVPAGGPSRDDLAAVEAIIGDPPEPCDCGEQKVVTLWDYGRHSWFPYASLCYRCRAERFDWEWYYLTSYIGEMN